MHRMETLDTGEGHILGGMKQDSAGSRHAPQHGTRFKTHELLPSGIFHFVFSERG